MSDPTPARAVSEPASPSPGGGSRFAHLDGLRGWAALLVVLYHGTLALDFALYSGQPADARTSWDIRLSGTPFFPLAPAGNVAVCVFFILSGYVLAHAYTRSRQAWLALAIRRYIRLGLPVLVGLGLAFLLLRLGLSWTGAAAQITHSSWLSWQVITDRSIGGVATAFFRLFFLYQAGRGSVYDNALWTMPIELSASLLILSVIVLVRGAGRHAGRVAGCVFALAAVLQIGSYFSLFAAGAAFRLLPPRRVFAYIGHRRWCGPVLLATAFACGSVPYSVARWPAYRCLIDAALHVTGHTRFWVHGPVSFWHAIGAVLLMVFVQSSPRAQAMLARPVGRFLGRVSFPLYILHLPIMSVVLCGGLVLWRLVAPPGGVGSLALFVAFVSVSLGVAAAATPVMEGRSIAASKWAGDAIDLWSRRGSLWLARSVRD
jgi:peptidoglycan/LPS O-acetylase OafA/YrhL